MHRPWPCAGERMLGPLVLERIQVRARHVNLVRKHSALCLGRGSHHAAPRVRFLAALPCPSDRISFIRKVFSVSPNYVADPDKILPSKCCFPPVLETITGPALLAPLLPCTQPFTLIGSTPI